MARWVEAKSQRRKRHRIKVNSKHLNDIEAPISPHDRAEDPAKTHPALVDSLCYCDAMQASTSSGNKERWQQVLWSHQPAYFWLQSYWQLFRCQKSNKATGGRALKRRISKQFKSVIVPRAISCQKQWILNKAGCALLKSIQLNTKHFKKLRKV